MDIFSINSKSFLSLADSFSKFAQMIPIDTKNLVDVKNALAKYFSTFGIPLQIITDHETTFRSIQLKNFLCNLGCSLTYASSSESNGQVEKTHSTIIEIYNTNKHKFVDMDTEALIPIAVSLYNATVHSATGYTPNEILFNQTNEMRPITIHEQAEKIFANAKTNIERSRQNQMKGNIRKETPPLIREGQEVYVKPNIRKKLDPRARNTTVNNVTDRTFENSRHIKRHKNKIHRIRS